MARGYLLLFALVVVCAAGVDARERSLLVSCPTGTSAVCGPDGTSCSGPVTNGGNPPPLNDADCGAGGYAVTGDCSGSCTLERTIEGVTYTFAISTDSTGKVIIVGPEGATIGTVIAKGSKANCVGQYSSGVYTPINNGGQRSDLSNIRFCFTPCVCTKEKIEKAVTDYKATLPSSDKIVCNVDEIVVPDIKVCGKSLVVKKTTVTDCGYVTITFNCPDDYNIKYEILTKYKIGDEDVTFIEGCPLKAKSKCVPHITPTYGTPTYDPAYCKFSVVATATGNCGAYNTKTIECTAKPPVV